MTKAFLEPDEIERLADAALTDRDRLLIILLFHLGCRVTECLGIAVDDIDLATGTVTIQHLKTRLQSNCPRCNARLGRKHTFCPGCGEKVEAVVTRAKLHRRLRTLPIDEEMAALVARYIETDGPVDRDGKRMLFPISRHRAWQIVRDCAARAGIGPLVNAETGRTHGVSPHRLRDAFAVLAMKTDDSGDGMRLLQEHLGHASFNTTAKYRKVAQEEHRNWFQRLWQNRPGKSL